MTEGVCSPLLSLYYEVVFDMMLLVHRYQQLPPQPPPPKVESESGASGPVEMVTVPALAAEWGKSELRDMTKAGKREKKAESRKEKWTAWNRGQRGMCGKYFTRKVFIWTLFGVCGL